MSLTSRFVASQAPLGRWTAGATAVGVAAGVLLAPAPGAAMSASDQSRVGASSTPAPATAHALIRTIGLPHEGRAVGVGLQLGDSIYIAVGNNSVGQVLQFDPVTLTQTGVTSVGRYPKGLAVSRDDTVYVVNAASGENSVSVVNGTSMTAAAPVTGAASPQSVGVSRSVDDTIFVSSARMDSIDADTLAVTSGPSLASGASPYGLAVSRDDSVYVSSYSGDKILNYTPATNTVSDAFTVADGPINGPIGVAVSDSDMVYFSQELNGLVTRFPATSPASATSIAVPDPQGIAIGADDTVYVASRGGRRIAVINPLTFVVDDSVSVSGTPLSVAVTRSGLVVSADSGGDFAWIIAAVTPSLVTTSAFAGTTGSLTIDGLPTGVTVDDTTVSSVAFGDDTVAWTRTAGTNTFTGPIPPGSGSVPVVVALNGGNSASAGTFTYATLPPPAPPTPSDPPGSVSAVAGDASASVSWTAPSKSGSFAVSTYQVMSSPGGRTCLGTAPSLSCEVTGLTNGTSYTFTVRALTGAGWSPSSEPSNAVTPEAAPRPSVVITGSRDGKRIEVSGKTTGFGMGGTLRPWTRFPGQSAYTEGAATILVSVDGTFEWGRKTGKRVSVYVQTPDGSLRSNTVTIGSR